MTNKPRLNKSDVTAAVKRAERIITEAAKATIGTKLIIPGRAAKWWNAEIRREVQARRQLWQQVKESPSDENMKNRYFVKRKEVCRLVKTTRANCMKSMYDKLNDDYREHKTKFWKGLKYVNKYSPSGITSLQCPRLGVVSSTAGKIQVASSHYQALFTCADQPEFHSDFKSFVEAEVQRYVRDSESDSGTYAELNEMPSQAEIAVALHQLQGSKAGSPLDNIVNELLKYGGTGMVNILQSMLSVVWMAETTPDHWHAGVISSIFKKGDKQDMNNYRGITLLSVVGKLHNRIINNRLVQIFDVGNVLHESQNGFRLRRNCVDHILTLSQLVLGRKKQRQRTYCFFLDIRKAYDTVWRDGLWYVLWRLGIRGKAWRIIRSMYANTRSCVSIDGCLGKFFSMENGVAQGDTLSPTLFSLYINNILEEVQDHNLGLGIDGKWLGALMFADDFVGACDTAEQLQRMINVTYNWLCKYRFQANISKSAVVVFGDNLPVEHSWTWGETEAIPIKPSYEYLGVHLERNCSWDLHALETVTEGVAKLAKLRHLFRNKDLSTQIKRTILLTVLKPALNYAGEVWEPSSDMAVRLEAILTDAGKDILQCGARTSAEPILADLGLSSLKADRTIQKLKYKRHVDRLPNHRLPRLVSQLQWSSVLRGRQTPMWTKLVEDLVNKYALDTPHVQGLADKQYDQLVKDSVAAHEHVARDISMRGKPKLELFLQANENMELKPYLSGPLSLGARLMFRFRSGNIALNGPMALSNRTLDPACPCCHAECESVTHCLVQCPAYDQFRADFMSHLRQVVGDVEFQRFMSGSDVDKTVNLLSPKWCPESMRFEVCTLVKQFMCKVWLNRNLHMSQRPGHTLTLSQTPPFGSAPSGGAEGYGQLTMPSIP